MHLQEVRTIKGQFETAGPFHCVATIHGYCNAGRIEGMLEPLLYVLIINKSAELGVSKER